MARFGRVWARDEAVAREVVLMDALTKCANEFEFLGTPSSAEIAIRRHAAKALANPSPAARALLAYEAAGGDFAALLWSFTGGYQLDGQCQPDGPFAATSPESDAMSKALKKLGFNFVGSTICYAFMQAAGMVNDHLQHCFRR